MKKPIRFLALALALVLSLGVLASCNGGGAGNVQTGNRGEDGSWDDVDFGGSTLKISVSANRPNETTMPECSIYTKGPDKTSSDNVQKKVYERNRDVANMLNLKVDYTTTNLPYADIPEDVEKWVQSSDSVDIYINDICALTRCMFQGYFTNLLNFGTNADGSKVQNFFDFSYDGWYEDYMKGLTLDSSKQYIMAGDYFVDLIRFAWVLFVNVTEFDATFAELQDWVSYDYTARRIDFAGDWDYDDLAFLAGKAHNDDKNKGTTDLEDTRIGLLFAGMSSRIASWTTGLSVVEWEDGEIGKGTPKIVGEAGTDPATKSLLSDVSVAYGKLYRAAGVYNTTGQKDCVDYFIDGKAVFSTVVLGEMESDSMRDVAFTRGVLPFPKYSSEAQEDFHTLVHDQAEVGVILKNAAAPTMASAYMQAINEKSATVLTEYYEKSLKVKYNTAGDSEGGVRLMIDLVHDTVDSPFESLIVGNYLYWYANGGIGKVAAYYHMGTDARNNSSNFSTNYDAAVPALAAYLKTMCDTFASYK
ncbi:MAG: hypothetical protein IJY71_02565 [Clostridia bacterium]|nr:hypothetical protein [Clostridia bacterium]